MCALGYSGAELDVTKVSIAFASEKGEITVGEKGVGIAFSEEKAAEILSADEIEIRIALGDRTALAAHCSTA